MNRPVGVIGVPTSAGAFAPGQEQAPQALREGGLLTSLRELGVEVHDHGDRPSWRWRPDRGNPRAQNVKAVVEIVRDTAERATRAGSGELTLVLGGDCTVGIGTVAGHLATNERVGLVYLDAHADLNVPDSVREGALDWMGLAHMLGVEGAVPELAGAGPRTPMLVADHVVLLGWDGAQATPFERAVLEEHDIAVVARDDVAAAPEQAARRAREHLEERCDRLLVHFDVDVIDFTDFPLSENTGRNEGLTYDHTLRALGALLESPLLAGLTITELNPDHTEHGAEDVERTATDVSRALAGAPAVGVA